MVAQILQKNQPSNLTGLVQNLNTNLTIIKPNNSEVTQIITYALIATAVVGLMVYQYIKEQERSPDSFSPKGIRTN